MQLCKLDVTEFTNVLASEAPAPGGGSTAALEGALGAALTAMVCALTAGKKTYAEWEAQTDAVRRRASAASSIISNGDCVQRRSPFWMASERRAFSSSVAFGRA